MDHIQETFRFKFGYVSSEDSYRPGQIRIHRPFDTNIDCNASVMAPVIGDLDRTVNVLRQFCDQKVKSFLIIDHNCFVFLNNLKIVKIGDTYNYNIRSIEK
jgi:hypothetical protein